MNNQRSPSTLTLLVTIVSLLGLGVLTGVVLSWNDEELLFLGALAGLAVISELCSFTPFPRSAASVSIALIIAAGTLSGLPGIAVVAIATVIADTAVHRVATHKAAFNAGALLLSGAAFVGVIEVLSVTYNSHDWVGMLGPVLLGTAAAFAVNSSLVAFAIALDQGEAVASVWHENCLWMLPHFAVMGVVALPMAAAFDRWELPGLLIPLVALGMVWLAIKQYADRAAALAPLTATSPRS